MSRQRLLTPKIVETMRADVDGLISEGDSHSQKLRNTLSLFTKPDCRKQHSEKCVVSHSIANISTLQTLREHSCLSQSWTTTSVFKNNFDWFIQFGFRLDSFNIVNSMWLSDLTMRIHFRSSFRHNVRLVQVRSASGRDRI
jgi:hypothetical protein